MKRSLSFLFVSLVLIAGLPGSPREAGAQFPPETLENLEVLSKDLSPREVIGIMRQFSIGLGVRCTHCHVGEANAPLTDVDFVSDEKPEKAKARIMFKMTRDINETYLAEPGIFDDSRVAVQCVTCHRGQPRPIMLEEALAEILSESGPEAAAAKYRELREEFYGSHTYDFSERTLINLAESQFQAGAMEAAEAMLTLNIEQFPESVSSWSSLAEMYRRNEDLDRAREAVKKALEIDPENRQALWIQGKIEEGGEE